MTIVDTTVWVAYLRGKPTAEATWLHGQMGVQDLGLTDLILCEVLQGLPDDSAFAAIRRQFESFQVFDTGGEALAVTAGRNYQMLRRKGKTVRKTIDCVIATFCIESGHSLLHQDRDFDLFESYLGLSVIHP